MPADTGSCHPDDLTLAPFGYDLAKLIVTTAMTHGPIPPRGIAAALIAYNRPLTAGQRCPAQRLVGFCEAHHLLTGLPRPGRLPPSPARRPALDGPE